MTGTGTGTGVAGRAGSAARPDRPDRPTTSVRVLRGPLGLSWRWRPRAVAVGAGLVVVLLALLVLAVMVGDFPVAFGDVVAALLGRAEGPSAFIVAELRLPRALAGIGAGAAFAVSGAIFQTLVRNPLGSPELIGFTQGASAGAVAGIVLGGATGAALAGSALAGGIATAVVVYLAAFRRGLLGTRLVLVGIGVGAMLNAVTWWLLTRAELTTAQSAAAWLVGSLNARTWTNVLVLAVALAVLVPGGVVVARWLRMVELGDEAARALGLPLRRVQLAAVALAIALCSAAVATAGPVPFIALAAPQLARRLVRGPGIGLVTSALVGAVLLLASDIVAQRALAPVGLPVGVTTGILGGAYLAWLLGTEGRGRARGSRGAGRSGGAGVSGSAGRPGPAGRAGRTEGQIA